MQMIPEIPLVEKEKRIILKKSARENMLSFLREIRSSGQIRKVFEAYRISGIKLKDIF
jgi:hypothetical protein